MHLPMKWSSAVRSFVCCALVLTLSTTTAAVADEPAPGRQQRQFEIRFMEGMIDHHTMAVMMAEICLEKDLPHEEELADLCQEVIAAQTPEIEDMQGWLEDWYDREYEPRMTRRMERQLENLAELEGARFEIEFMTMLIRHHEEAIRNARQCLRQAYHEELAELCENIIESQSAEIEQLERWLCQWYHHCKHSRRHH